MTVTLRRLLSRIEWCCDTIVVILMAMIMLIAVADVMMRYVFNSPFSWTYDLISLYLMVGLFYLALSSVFANHGHISVDILNAHMPLRLRRCCEIAICATALVFFALITETGTERAWESYTNADVVAGVIPWPTWPSIALVPLGAGLMTLRLGLHLIDHVASLVSGRSYIELTPVVGSPEALARGTGE